MKKLTEVLAARGVGVYLHWTTLVVGGVILLGAFENLQKRCGLGLVFLRFFNP
jgi:hypothetical protein